MCVCVNAFMCVRASMYVHRYSYTCVSEKKNHRRQTLFAPPVSGASPVHVFRIYHAHINFARQTSKVSQGQQPVVSVYCLAYIIYKMQLPWSYYKHTNMYKLHTHLYIDILYICIILFYVYCVCIICTCACESVQYL